jgi:transposase
MDCFLHREYARAVRGQKVFGLVSGKKYKRVSIVAAQCEKRILSPMQYEGTTDSVLFEYWFEYILLPELSFGSVIVMDNAAFHRKKILRQLAAKVGCALLFLPPYSPDLNRIEHFWVWLKQRLKSILKTVDDFDEAVADAFKVE